MMGEDAINLKNKELMEAAEQLTSLTRKKSVILK
jgi:hypothetical protein